MKLKHFGLLTLASMAMIACNNENEGLISEQDNSPKKVVLKLEGISSGNSRSTDAPTTDGGTNKHSVSLKDVAIFLYADGGVIYNALEIASTNSTDWGKITGSDGYTFENVDPAVNRVMVIGNYDNLETNNSFGTAVSLVNSTAASLMTKTIDLKSQNVSAQESDDATTSTKAVMTLFGSTPSNIQDTDGDGVYEAAVSIKPIVSRLEVKSVSCKFVEPVGTGGIVKSATVTVQGIGLFDYYNNMTLDGKALTNLMDATKILEPGTASVSEGQYVFLGDAADWTWAFDKTTDTDYNNVLSDATSTGAAQEMTTKVGSNSATFAYNFFPVASGTTIDGAASQPTNQALANIRLYVNVTNSTSDTNKDYVVTTAFRDATGNIVTPAPGKIYQLDYAFETDNIRESWGDDKIKVNVTVTTVEWDIIPVTPSF